VDGTVHLQDVAVEESQVLLSEIPGQSDTGNMDLVCAPRTRGPVHANASARLSDTVVDVTAEIGRLSLRGSGLAAAFRKGELQPEVDASRDVQLWVEGAPWFVGEVVDVDGDLGVRLKSKRAG
jgi:flagellar motor switch/type III secretory pathway protein FliN